MRTLFCLIVAVLASIQFAFAAIDINTAAESELDQLPGIGPTKAKAIVEDRRKNGPFKSVEDLKRVKGIGDKTFDEIKGQITASGGGRTARRSEAKPAAPVESHPAPVKAKSAAAPVPAPAGAKPPPAMAGIPAPAGAQPAGPPAAIPGPAGARPTAAPAPAPAGAKPAATSAPAPAGAAPAASSPAPPAPAGAKAAAASAAKPAEKK